jgi:hypothetical protein
MIRTTTRIAALLASGVLAVACGKADQHDHAHAATPATGSPVVKDHGSHDPAHGGMVLMDGHDHHAELVLDPATGAHRVYVSDGARAVLPASTFDTVTLTITQPGAAAEQLAMTRAIDDSHWVAAGKPVPTTGANVKLTYTKGGSTLYDVELAVEYVLTGKAPIAALHGGLVAAIPGGHVELLADASGTFKVWLFDDDRALLPPDAAAVSLTTSQKGYGTVALVPSGDHLAGTGKPIKGGHAMATITVERGGKPSTANIALHLEGGGGGHHGH